MRQRAVVYLRQSTYREESISLDSQEHICREHAARCGYEVVGVESDPGVSGRTWQRRGVQAAMSALEEHRADVVILWKWSRLSRNRRDWAIAADRADLAGGRIESATEPIDTNSAAGRFQRGVMVEMAAFESDRIGETWRETHEYRVRNGLPPTGGPRFGYVRDEHGTYSPDPTTAPVLADAYRWFLAGDGFMTITRRLNELGVHSSKGAWSTQGLTAMLDSGFAAGLLGRGTSRNGKRYLPPPWERTYVDGLQEPIINRATWDGYVACRRGRYRKPMRTATRYTMTGLMRCGDCGGPMCGVVLGGVPSYVCTRAIQKRDRPRLSIVASKVDAVVEAWVFSLATDVDMQELAVSKTTMRRQRADTVQTRMRKELAKADERLVQLALRLADGTITDAVYKLAAAKVEAGRIALDEQLARTVANPVKENAPAQVPHGLELLWPQMTPEDRASVLRPLLRDVVVHRSEFRSDGRVEVRPAWDD